MSWCLAVLKYSCIAAKCLHFLLPCSWYRATSVSSLFYAITFCHPLLVVLGYNKQHQYFILGATLATALGIKLQSLNHLFTCNEYIHSRAACFFPSPTTSTTSIASTPAKAAATFLEEINWCSMRENVSPFREWEAKLSDGVDAVPRSASASLPIGSFPQKETHASRRSIVLRCRHFGCTRWWTSGRRRSKARFFSIVSIVRGQLVFEEQKRETEQDGCTPIG